MKFLIWALIAFLVLAWVMRSKKVTRRTSPGHTGTSPSGRGGRPEAGPEAVLPCARCGLHVPASEAVRHTPGTVFCCEEHRRQTFPDA